MASTTRIEVSPDAARTIAKEAYIYGFAPVYAYRTMHNEAIDRQHPEFRASFNELGCQARLLTAEDKTFPAPNADTPYCFGWLDLRAEPQVLTIPEVDPERFYDYQLEDFYTHNFGYAGALWTGDLGTGNDGGTFLIAGPRWSGSKPDGVEDVFESETDFVFNVSRVQLYGPDDLDNVARLQKGFELQPLSEYLGKAPPEPAPELDFPEWIEGAQYDERLFGYLDFALSLLGQPHEDDAPLWERMEMIGLGPEGRFDFEVLPPEHREALRDGAKQGWAEIERFIQEYGDDPLLSAKALGTRETLRRSARENFEHENYYLIRAAAAQLGIFGNVAKEALYPLFLTDADGEPLDASQSDYTMTFEPGELPPVQGFWSLSMYDDKMLFVDNALDRYLLNSRMMDLDQFVFGDDGSLTFYISADSPGPNSTGNGRESNWLPAPDGPFRMLLRMYGPSQDAQKGRWTPPRPKKVEGVRAERRPRL